MKPEILHYGERKVPPRRRRLLIALLAVAGAVAIAAPTLRQVASTCCERAALLRSQARCESCEGPSQIPAYDEVASWDPNYTGRHEYQHSALPPRAAMYMPECLREYAKVSLQVDDLNSTAAIFVHERTSRNGQRYLVVVQCDPAFLDPEDPVSGLRASAFQEVGLFSSRPLSEAISSTSGIHPGRPVPLRLFRIFQVAIGVSESTVDGSITDSGQVGLTVRKRNGE
jgi:hypothetical protein